MTTITATGLNFGFTEEQEALRTSVRELVERSFPKSVARELEASTEFPWELRRMIGEAGLNGIGVAEEYGGQGGDLIDQVIVCAELSRSLGGLSWIWGVTAWSAVKALTKHASDEQRARFLPEIAEGRLLVAFALTEPGGGTDVLRAMRTRATKVEGGYRLSGNKIWSTMANVADRILVLARTSDHDKPSKGLTMFFVDGRSEGFNATPIPKLGMRAVPSCEIALDEVFVPDEDVIGEVDQGWTQVLSSLNPERIMTAAVCMGILEGVLEDAIEYANTREAFGKKIGAMQSIQHGIADIAMKLETTRLHTYRAAWLEREGRPCGVEATTAKCLAAEYATEAADFGIQVLGGYGYAQEFDMQRYWRDARLYRIGPITSEMARNYVGEQLGLPRSF